MIKFKTREEFENYIKNNINYLNTLDIGVLHKCCLDSKDKNWERLLEFVKTLNLPTYNMTSNAFRCRVNRLIKGALNYYGSLEQFLMSIAPHPYNTSETKENNNLKPTTDSNVEENKTNAAEEKLQELYKQTTKNRDILNAYRRGLRDDARIDVLKETIESSIEKLNKLPDIQYQNNDRNNTLEAVLLLSDLHVGVECDNFVNKYNIDIARQRLEKLANEVILYCKKNNVSTLHVVNLGDMIQGIIHITSRIESQIDVVEQVMVASELLAKFLNKMQAAAPHIVYRSCTDNHSRIIADKSQHIEKENLGKIIDWYLESRLADTPIKFSKSNLDDSLGYFELQNGKKCIFVHGHLDSIDKSLQNFVGALKTFVDYVFFGHYHSEKMKSFQNCKVFVNGSIVGTEQYALSKRLFNRPSQKLIIFDGDNELDFSINLD